MNINNVNFNELTYLKFGNQKQQEVYKIMTELQLMEKLREFDPILVGTIPLAIDLPESDLDVICYVSDLRYFREVIKERLGDTHKLHFSYSSNDDLESLVVQFTYKEWPFELFAQPISTKLQNGYRHMVVEHRILSILGDEARHSIIKLKRSGIKTEPAFAKMLGLDGDPYEQLLVLSEWSDDRLREFVVNKDYIVVNKEESPQ
ncbi:DUF4269 domain-containing protein [Paenibacillus sp. GCM10028914]